MMKIQSLAAALAFCLVSPIPPALAQGQPAGPSTFTTAIGPFGPPNSSLQCDFEMVSDGRKMTGLYVYVAKRERWEFRINPSATIIAILYTDLGVGYTILPMLRAYFEIDHNSPEMNPSGSRRMAWKIEKLEGDTKDGLVRSHYRVDGKSPSGDSFSGEMWLAVAYNLVVEARGTAISRGKSHQHDFRVTALRVGVQDPALFYPPPDYERRGTGLGVQPVKP